MVARRLVFIISFVIGVLGIACSSAEEGPDDELAAASSEELTEGTFLRCGVGCPGGSHPVQPLCISTCGGCNGGRFSNATMCSTNKPVQKLVCGSACGAGYAAQFPTCLPQCGSCARGSNATQCVKIKPAAPPPDGVTCGFTCPLGERVAKRLCVSQCGGCPYGTNAVRCD